MILVLVHECIGGTKRLKLLDVVIVISLKLNQVLCFQVVSDIDLTCLKSHGTCCLVIHTFQCNFIKGNFSIPVVLIFYYDTGIRRAERFYCVRSCTDRSFHGKCRIIYICIYDQKQRVCKASGHVCICSVQVEDQVLSINLDAVEIKEFRNTVTLFSGTLDGSFYHLWCHIVAVGEFYALTDLEGPCFSIVAVLPFFCKTWNDLTVLIEFCEALSDRITGYYPAEILLCRLQCICKACYSDGDLLITFFVTFCLSHCCHGKSHHACKCSSQHFFNYVISHFILLKINNTDHMVLVCYRVVLLILARIQYITDAVSKHVENNNTDHDSDTRVDHKPWRFCHVGPSFIQHQSPFRCRRGCTKSQE